MLRAMLVAEMERQPFPIMLLRSQKLVERDVVRLLRDKFDAAKNRRKESILCGGRTHRLYFPAGKDGIAAHDRYRNPQPICQTDGGIDLTHGWMPFPHYVRDWALEVWYEQA